MNPTGRATTAELQDLHRALLANLVRRLRARKVVPVDILHESRAFLVDNGHTGPAVGTKASARMLDLLDKRYQEALLAALKSAPRAGVLAEARAYAERLKRQQEATKAAQEVFQLPYLAPLNPQ